MDCLSNWSLTIGHLDIWAFGHMELTTKMLCLSNRQTIASLSTQLQMPKANLIESSIYGSGYMLRLLLLHVSEATTKVGWSNFFLPLGYVQTDATTPNIVAPKRLGVVELRACWQWCANGYNNSQQGWDLRCIMGRIQPITLCKPCVMSVRGPNNVGRVVQTDPTLLRYASAITEQKKCWEFLAEKCDRFQTLRNNTQQQATTCNKVKRTQHVTSNNVGSCWPTMLGPFTRGLRHQCLTANVTVGKPQSQLNLS